MGGEVGRVPSAGETTGPKVTPRSFGPAYRQASFYFARAGKLGLLLDLFWTGDLLRRFIVAVKRVPPPPETPVEVVVSGRTSTLKFIKIVKVGWQIPKTFSDAGQGTS